MLKHLTLLSIASVLTLTTGCLITTGDTSDTATSTATDTDTTTEGTTAGTTTTMGTTTMGTTATGTASDSMTSTATDATTMGTTDDTTAGTTSQESTSTTDGTTTDDTTTSAEPGCGWSEREMYYDCAPPVGVGVAGLEDPMGLDPLACPDQKLADGEPCVEVKEIGCCDADQNLWYCNNGSLVFGMCIP